MSRWIEYQLKSNEKYMPFLHFISHFEGSYTSYKSLKIKPLDLLFLVFISFYISRYQFLQIFRTSLKQTLNLHVDVALLNYMYHSSVLKIEEFVGENISEFHFSETTIAISS